MSTWISDLRRWGLAILALPLAACLDDRKGAEPVMRTGLYGGEVVVTAPPGYCIDDTHLQRRGESRVVVMAGCSRLVGDGPAVDAAVMTVSVLPRDPGARRPSAGELAEIVGPEAEALDTLDRDGLALVHVSAGGEPAMPGGDARYWRGSMLINGHLTGLAVYARRDSRLAGSDGRYLIVELADTLRRSNPPGGPLPEEPPDPEPETETGSGLGTFLSGLFGNPG